MPEPLDCQHTIFSHLLRTLLGAGVAFMAHPQAACSVTMNLATGNATPYATNTRHQNTTSHSLLHAARDEQALKGALGNLHAFIVAHPNALFHPQFTLFVTFQRPTAPWGDPPQACTTSITLSGHIIVQGEDIDVAVARTTTLVEQCRKLPLFGDRLFSVKTSSAKTPHPPFQAHSPQAAAALHALLMIGGTNRRKIETPKVSEIFAQDTYEPAYVQLLTSARARATTNRKDPS